MSVNGREYKVKIINNNRVSAQITEFTCVNPYCVRVLLAAYRKYYSGDLYEIFIDGTVCSEIDWRLADGN